jgi:prevent-host-death family protein
MKEIAATDAKQGFGKALEDAMEAPVRILKNGRPAAYLVAAPSYELLERIAQSPAGKRLAVVDAYLTGETPADETMRALGLATRQELLYEVAQLGRGLPRLPRPEAEALALSAIKHLKGVSK